MNLSGEKGRLVSLTKELLVRWQEARNYWRDTKSDEFDQRYIQELTAHVDKTVTILDKLDEVLRKIQHDCE